MSTSVIIDNPLDRLPLDKVKRVSTRSARDQFSDLIGQVHYTGEPVIVERSGRPMVVLLSFESYEQLLRERTIPSALGQADEPAAQPVIESLFGAFPELAAITDEDLAWVKEQWNQSLEKQLRIIDGADL